MKAIWYVLAIVVLLFALSLFFQVNTIEAEGNTRYDTEDIVNASGLKPGGSLFLFDKSGAESRIIENFSFIEKVTIKRKLPDTLLISVIERVPLAKITMYDGKFALIDRNSRVIDIVEESSEGIELRGIAPVECTLGELYAAKTETETEALDYALEILNELYINDLTGDITYMEASVLNPIFDYGPDYLIEVGKREETEKKISFLKSALPSMEKGYKATINLSIPGTAHFIPD